MDRSIVFTRPFRSDAKKLAKSYPKVKAQIRGLVDNLKRGHIEGDRMQGVGGAVVYETRLPNPDASKGKSGGFRMVYHVGARSITLIAICTRKDWHRINPARIRQLLKDLHLS